MDSEPIRLIGKLPCQCSRRPELVAQRKTKETFASSDRVSLGPVTVVDLNEIVRGEFAENADRKDFPAYGD
jgi:hypothetical protein